LRDIGPLSIGRSGAYITPHPNVVDIIKAKFGTDEEDTLYDPDNPICPVPDDTSNLDYADANADGYRPRWMLPQDMQLDLRALRREAVVRLIHDETTTSGEVLGYDPVTNESIALKTGRFGKYIQIGDNDDKNKRYAGAPQWLDKTVPFEGVLDIANLPKCIGMHPVLNLPIMVECYAKLLQVSIENFPIRVAAPYGALVSQITPEIATELLGDPEEILASQKILGTNEATGEVVMIRKGPYGFYLQCGARYCGLGKLNKDEVDLNLALETLEKRGKVRGEKKAKKKAAKAAAKGAKEDKDAKTKRKPKAKAKATQRLTKRAKERANVKKLNLAASKVKAVVRRTGYQIFSSESMKAGKSMKEVGAAWKELSDNKKAEYKAKAVAMMAASQNEEGSKATEASNTDGNTDGGAGDASPIARPKPKPKPKKQSSDLTNA
jgi:topoisomerase IA-like protein